MDVAEFPKVTPYMLRVADTACPRRLRREFEGRDGGSDPVHRGRVRDRVLEAARNAHSSLRTPDITMFTPPPELVPEEAALFERCAHTYCELFGTEAAISVRTACDEGPTVHAKRQLRIGGWVDLTLEDAHGGRILRQLDLWGRPPPADPVELPAVKVALLRLARWIGEQPVHVTQADLVTAARTDRVVNLATEIDALRAWFDDRVAILQHRILADEPIMSSECGTCRYVPGCPLHK